jgi:hypothetical protein
MRQPTLPFALLAALLGAGLPAPAAAQRFLPEDPVQRDLDDLPVPVVPGEVELSGGWEVIDNTFLQDRPRAGRIPPAQNVNTLGEVPDSSWWTNRIGVRPLSLEELVRGPGSVGPDTSGPWTVIRGKASGITPGFTIRDARGDVYFLKLDPERYFGLSTGAEVIGTRIFHALGYFVPETTIVYARREAIRVGEEASIKLRGQKPRKMSAADLDRVLQGVAALADGSIRFVASKAIPGRVIGPHKYYGTRPDDPNDVIPHEDRRELRGYRVFCAWLNHDDSRSINSLNSYVSENGRGYVRHYLQDFSSILGSGSDWRRAIAPQNPRAGNEYIVELTPMLKTFFSLGLWQRTWHHVEYDVYPQAGAIEADFFEPDAWKPEFPNMAFLSMLPEDAFWAARLVSKIGEEAIRAIVKQADYRAPEAEAHLVATMLRRRSKVLATYFGPLNPLADFRVEADAAGAASVAFTNYGEDARLATVDAYAYQWFRFDNLTQATQPLGSEASTTARRLPLPPERPEYLMLRLRTQASGMPGWSKRVDVFLRTADLKVVGIDRES